MPKYKNNPFQNALREYQKSNNYDLQKMALLAGTSTSCMCRFLSGHTIPVALTFCAVCVKLELNIVKITSAMSEFYFTHGAHYKGS